MYINLLDLYYDIDPVGFQKNVTKPILTSYVDYYEKYSLSTDGIDSASINQRLTIMFCNRIVMGKLDLKKDNSRDNFDSVYEQASKFLGTIPNSAILLNNGSFLAFLPNNYGKILYLLTLVSR